jgi:hypothetical protein
MMIGAHSVSAECEKYLSHSQRKFLRGLSASFSFPLNDVEEAGNGETEMTVEGEQLVSLSSSRRVQSVEREKAKKRWQALLQQVSRVVGGGKTYHALYLILQC